MEMYGVSNREEPRFCSEERRVESLEIWLMKSSEPVIRTLVLQTDSDDFLDWLNQEGMFAAPIIPSDDQLEWTLRLLHSNFDGNQEIWMFPFSNKRWETTRDKLRLPRTYHRELGIYGASPLSLTFTSPGAGSLVDMVFNTVPSGSCGMTMGLSYDPKRHMTQGFFGYRVVPGFYSYGAMVIQDLKSTARYIPEPLLLPFAAYEQLEYKFQKDLLAASTALDIFNRDKRFTDIFLDSDSDQAQTSSVTLGYQDLHRTIVNYHTILANSYGPFLTAFGLSLRSACSKLEQQSFSGGVDGSDTPECQRYDSFQSRQCIETLIARSEYLHLSRSRLLTKMDIYLQVIHNFMQQDIARETKRDSSAMKSLSLLTMVFLPTTAIATIMDPFTQVSWNDEITVTSQFWVFWAAAAPVTLIVLIIGVSWIHKAECQQAFMTKVAHLKRFGLFQRRVKVGDIESKAESNLIVLRTTMAIQDASESASDTATAPRRSTSGRSSKAVEDCVAV